MRHFLEVEQFKSEEFIGLAERGIEIKNGASLNKNGKSIVNMFFESSTRTKMSFEVAEKQMDFHTYNFDVTTSAVNKGESLYDSILTMKALGMDIAVIRHQNNAYYKDLLDIGISIVNAGSGSGEHPSQCLLDLMTIVEEFGSIQGRKIAIVGDLKHSRVARSNAKILHELGATLYFCSPEEYYDDDFENYGTYQMIDEVISEVDVLMMLRIQFERHTSKARYIDTEAAYLRDYGLNQKRYQQLKKDAIIMHPAPVNRDVEIESSLVESEKSRIVRQMENGVFARMAILEWVKGE
ncbi:aspartate carbamoyltransferase [Atopostipes suicloacalis DSM 15692]|uniref:Aspartate carbamoyltransferase n=1 Tax=Atopostipes suicloacalis DSM 15692 TaxID=1121025 RepID=A0A1M4VQ80_9LACT|nr:aspartate carbamoyltransferase catalytic subunit [Atopostipes suicloacalis]SHE71214.1 aspartate carbamoyltransferase [Atopostipes suicloacalis DSM 15692]